MYHCIMYHFSFIVKIFLFSAAIFLFILIGTIIELNSEKKTNSTKFNDKLYNQFYVKFPSIMKTIRYHYFNNINIFLTFPFLSNNLEYVSNLYSPLTHFVASRHPLLMIESQKGVYNKNTMLLTLDKGVGVFYSSGYHFQADSVQVDVRNGHAYAATPVAGYGPFGAITGEGLHLLDEGCIVILTGQSFLLSEDVLNFN